MHTIAGGVVREAAWASGDQAGSKYARIEVGTLPSGAWYAWHTKHAGGAYVTVTERAAWELADKWMRRGEWISTPARFGPDGQPADGRPWVRSGGSWLPGKEPAGA